MIVQYIATVALNHEEVGNNSQRKSKIKLFISKHNWNRMTIPSGKDDWKCLRKTISNNCS